MGVATGHHATRPRHPPTHAAGILRLMKTTTRAFGGQSMSAPLLDVLVKRPGPAFEAAFENPDHGFFHAPDLALAQREHDVFVDTLARLGATVHVLETETESPDLVYAFDPLLVTDRGAIPLRPGKANRLGEPAAIEAWTLAAGIPTVGRIEAPGTAEGGDTLWLRPDLFCIGRSLRTNDAGARQLAELVGGDVRIFDVPYWHGPSKLVHLMSVISPIADDLAVVYLPLLPVGLWALLGELGIRLIEVTDEEYWTLGCNVLAVRPGVVIIAEGNPLIAAALAAAGCEVHTYPATEIGLNGSGGPTCMARPILRG
jgi:dimethylargininase